MCFFLTPLRGPANRAAVQVPLVLACLQTLCGHNPEHGARAHTVRLIYQAFHQMLYGHDLRVSALTCSIQGRAWAPRKPLWTSGWFLRPKCPATNDMRLRFCRQIEQVSAVLVICVSYLRDECQGSAKRMTVALALGEFQGLCRYT